ncbi:MAG TPA: hypothetical protein VF786_08780 [Terriglobales bacterium]
MVLRKLAFVVGALLFALLMDSCARTGGAEVPVHGGPPLGRYRCWAGGFENLSSGEFTLLPGGRYQDSRKGGGGTYLYDPDTASLNFLTGDFEYWEFSAMWQHGSNTEHPQRLVIRYRGDSAPVGSERAGRYQYCYLESEPVQTASKAR